MNYSKRLMIGLFSFILLLCPLQAFAMEAVEEPDVEVLSLASGETGIMPRWMYTAEVFLKLSFSGSTAVCELGVTGATSASSVKANLWLYQQNDDGSWTVLNSWKNITSSTGDLDIVRYYNPVYYGETYKLYFTGKCYGPNGVYYDALAAETIVTR